MKAFKIIFLIVAMLGGIQINAQEKSNVDEMLVKMNSDKDENGNIINNYFEVVVTIKNPHLASQLTITAANAENEQVAVSKTAVLTQKSGVIYYTVDNKEYQLKNNKATLRLDIGTRAFEELIVLYQLD